MSYFTICEAPGSRGAVPPHSQLQMWHGIGGQSIHPLSSCIPCSFFQHGFTWIRLPLLLRVLNYSNRGCNVNKFWNVFCPGLFVEETTKGTRYSLDNTDAGLKNITETKNCFWAGYYVAFLVWFRDFAVCLGFFLVIMGFFQIVIRTEAFQDKHAPKRLCFLAVNFYWLCLCSTFLRAELGLFLWSQGQVIQSYHRISISYWEVKYGIYQQPMPVWTSCIKIKERGKCCWRIMCTKLCEARIKSNEIK